MCQVNKRHLTLLLTFHWGSVIWLLSMRGDWKVWSSHVPRRRGCGFGKELANLFYHTSFYFSLIAIEREEERKIQRLSINRVQQVQLMLQSFLGQEFSIVFGVRIMSSKNSLEVPEERGSHGFYLMIPN